VFIDETWTKTNMTRLRGWAPKGERLVDKVPHGRWKTATFLAALRNDRIDAPCLFDGPINGERFHAYVEQFLVPTLKPGDVVILDNLGSHKGRRGCADCPCAVPRAFSPACNYREAVSGVRISRPIRRRSTSTCCVIPLWRR
jgi:hypothetical protein